MQRHVPSCRRDLEDQICELGWQWLARLQMAKGSLLTGNDHVFALCQPSNEADDARTA